MIPGPADGEPPRDEPSGDEPSGDEPSGDEVEGHGEAGGPRIGDLVVIPVPRIRAQVGCGERVGVALEARRAVVKVLFPDVDRAYWVERKALQAIPEGRLPTHPLALRLHRIARAVRAVEIEVYDREGDADVFHVYTARSDLAALESVREGLGADFRRLAVEPGGVRRAKVVVVFRT